MGAILVKPANEEEYRLVTQLLKKMRVKSEIVTDEDMEEVKAYDKAMLRMIKEPETFLPAEQVFEQIEAKRKKRK
jgi:hypothetical protein